MRYEGYLTPATGGRWPHYVICLDVIGEEYEDWHNDRKVRDAFVSWHAACLKLSGGRYEHLCINEGLSRSEFWCLLQNWSGRKHEITIMCHNAQKCWALLGLWERLENGDIILTGRDERSATGCDSINGRTTQGFIVTENPPSIACFSWRDALGNIQWLDTRNFAASPDPATTAGLVTASWVAEWFHGYHRLAQQYGLGSLCVSGGAQAMHAFRSNYLKTGVYLNANPAYLGVEAEGYYGGRCEAFRIGHFVNHVWHLDFRSLYPACMRDAPIAVRLVRHIRSPDTSQARALATGERCLARVSLDTDEPAYPLRRNGLTTWPVGRYTTVLAGPELRDAVERDRVTHWFELLEYETDNCLHEYAARLHDMRSMCEGEGNAGLAASAKQLLVALPGKFGQLDKRWVSAASSGIDLLYGEWYGSGPDRKPCRFRSLAGNVQREQVLGFADHAVPSVAAWITSAARMRLLAAIRCAGWENVIYVDTDAIFTTNVGYSRLCGHGFVGNRTMGLLDLKDSGPTIEIRGVKYYVFNNKVTCSGLPRSQCEDCGDGLHYWYTRSVADQVADRERPASERVRRPYMRMSEYKLGDVQSDGRVLPWRMTEIEG